MGMKDLFGDQLYEQRKPDYKPYGGEPPSVRNSATSRKAAAQIKQRVGPLHAAIIEFLTNSPKGATDEEMQAQIPMTANTQRPRRRELELMGRVIDSGEVKLTKTRRWAVVWKLARVEG